MEKTKVMLAYMIFIFSFFGNTYPCLYDLSYEKNVNKSSINFRSDIKNLSFVSDLEKKLENNYITEFMKKKLTNFIFSNRNISNGKIDKSKSKNKKSSYLYKPYVVLKNDTNKVKPLRITYIKKNGSYVLDKYIYDERKENMLDNITYSFMELEDTKLTESKVLTDYKDLMIKLNEGYNKGKNIYINTCSYKDMECFFNAKQKKNYDKFKDTIVPSIIQIAQNSQQYMNYCDKSKNELRKEMNELEQLVENKDKTEYTQKINKFESKIKEITEKLDKDIKEIEKDKDAAYSSLNECIWEEHSKSRPQDVRLIYRRAFGKYYVFVRQYREIYNSVSKDYENFVKTNSTLLKIKDKDFYQKKHKYTLKLLLEEIDDIIEICKKNKEVLSEYFNPFDDAKRNISNFKLESSTLLKTVLFPAFVYYAYYQEQQWVLKIKEELENKNRAVDDLFKKIVNELGDEIDSLIYPSQIEPECAQIIENAEQVVSEIESQVRQKCEELEDLTYNYSTTEIFTIRTNLTRSFAEADTYNSNLKSKLQSISEIYRSITADKEKIETLKKSLPRNDENKLNDIRDDVLEAKTNIEGIIASADEKHKSIQEGQKQLNDLKGTIEELIRNIETNKERMERLIRDEDEEKRKIILQITEELNKIEAKKSELQPFMDLKGKENADLKTSKEVIDSFSCDKKEIHKQKKDSAKQKLESALNSLFGSEKIENAYREIPSYVSENKNKDHMKNDLNSLNELLGKIIEKSTEIDDIIREGTNAMKNNVVPAEDDLKELKKILLKESIEDFLKKMQESYKNFMSTLSFIDSKMKEYEQKNIKLKSYEKDIEERKCELLSNFVEENKNELKGKDTYQEIMDLEQVIILEKSLISKEINNGNNMISTITIQLELYSTIEKFLNLIDDSNCQELKQLKITIQDTNVEKKINDCDSAYKIITKSMDDALKNVKLSKKIIEELKIINKMVNGSFKNNEVIEKLRVNLNKLEEIINKQNESIMENSLIEREVKEQLSRSLTIEKEKIEAERKKIEDQEKISNEFLKSCSSFKETVRNANETNINTHSQQVSNDKAKLEIITQETASLNVSITKLNVDVENLINAQNDKIVGLIYDLITKLNKDIGSKVTESEETIEATYKGFEKYNMEKDIKNMSNETNKKNLGILSQEFNNIKIEIDEQKNKFVIIEERSKNEVTASDKIKEYTVKTNDNIIQMKNIHSNMKNILGDCVILENELKSAVDKINTKQIEYKKILVDDYHEQINDKKKNAETEIKIIDRYKEKIHQLKSSIPDTIDCILQNYDYQSDASNSKKNQENINRIEGEVNILKENIAKTKNVEEVHIILTTVEQKLEEVTNEKRKIDNASKSITHMEKMLAMTSFSIVMSDIEKNAQKAKEEEVEAKQKLIESERTKKLVWNDLKDAEKLGNSVIDNFEEESINESVEHIRKLHIRIVSYIEKIYVLLTRVNKHKEDASLYYDNTVRGREKITYLKKHDEDKNEKNITEEVEKKVNEHVSDSLKNANKVATYAEETKNIYDISLEYGTDMKTILDDSLILGEKLKVSIKKNEAVNILVEIQGEYYNNILLLEKLLERLTILQNEDAHKNNEEDSNNHKSIDAFTKIEVTKTNATSTIQEIREIKKKTLTIMNDAELEFDTFITEYENNCKALKDKLKLEQDTLQKASKLYVEFTYKMKNFTMESNKIIKIKTMVHNLEGEMEINKKQYEEGIIEEIKKIADQEKKILEFLKESMRRIMDTSITFMKNSALGPELIIQKFEDPEKNMNEKYVSFYNSYKEIEKEALSILNSSNTYKSVKVKREKAKLEKKKLEVLNAEMNILINRMKYIKTREILRLIFYMKNELDKIYGNSQNEHFKMKKYTEDIKRNVQNIINATSVSAALSELDDAKNKFSAFKESKIAHSSYKYNAYSIYIEINKDMEFIDINLEHLEALSSHEDIKNVEDILLIIQGDSYDIDNKEKENEKNIMYMKSLYKQVKVRENIRKNIKKKRDEINTLLQDAQYSLNSYKKIKEINVDANDYGKYVKNSKQYENFIKKHNSYKEIYNNMKINLKIDEITKKLNTYMETLNDLDKHIKGSNVVEFTESILEKAKDNISNVTNKINDVNNNILEIHSSLNKLLELRRKCKLYFLYLVITSINTKISKDLILFEKKKVNVIELMEYVITIYDSINKDINTTNKCFSKRLISSYNSRNIEDLNKLVEDFKRKEQKVMERISDIKKKFVESNKRKDSIYIDESLNKLKYAYKEYKKEKKDFKNIYKKMNEAELKEREDSAEKLLNISEAYKEVIERQRQKILDNKNKLEEMEYFIRKDCQELFDMEDIDTNKKSIQKFNAAYEAIMNKMKILDKLENKNNRAKTKLTNHFPQVSYLIDRAKSLIKETKLYEHEIDYDLSKKENMEILYEVHNYIKSAEIKLEESRKILEELRKCIDHNNMFVHKNDIMIHSIYYMVNKINKIKEYNQKEVTKNGEIIPNKIIGVHDTDVVINNNIDNHFKFDMMNCKSCQKNKFDNSKFKLIAVILITLLILYVVAISILYKKKNEKKKRGLRRNQKNVRILKM